ncbi:MAG: type II toxin-antitoxin system Phd/YefM family antitoxin [Myxococcota bacterium]
MNVRGAKRPAVKSARAASLLAASDFKARCLAILDQVQAEGREFVITKRGRPVARVVPERAIRRSLRGAGKGLVEIRGDIVHCDWSGEFEALGD